MATIGAILKLIFPNGTLAPPETGGRKPGLAHIPTYAPDTFAAVATLLDWSGAYQYLWLAADHPLGADPLGVLSHEARARRQAMAAAYAYRVPFQKVAEERDALAESACRFVERRYPRDPKDATAELEPIDKQTIIDAGKELQALWDAIISCKDLPVIDAASPEVAGSLPPWWSAAVRLLIVADDACAGLGFHSAEQTMIQIAHDIVVGGSGSVTPVETLCSKLVNGDMVTVLPKTKTSQVGCTMRALTHNLAALPPRGQVSARWLLARDKPVAAFSGDGPAEFLNLLLVPFPYRIPSRCFEANGEGNTFTTKQHWLHRDSEAQWGAESLAKFVNALCRVCKSGGVPIHGVVFPEYSLDWRTYDTISTGLLGAFPDDIEFVIAGVSNRESDPAESGNWVAMRGRLRTECESVGAANDWDYTSVRGKHHRWRLNKLQIERYGLSHRFKGPKDAWEDIRIGRRLIEFVEPRAGTSLTTLICEDLARIDPCQQVIRAVGPNLVVALLMDGPQIVTRWPRHYAGVLADDPGSSVLTLSSLGLIERASPTDPSRSRAVAYWKDPTRETELHLATGNHALAVSLKAKPTTEFTLDGRSDYGRSFAWELAQAQSVRAAAGDAPDWILQGAGEF